MLSFSPLSVAVEEAYEAERRGDQKREFNILQAHLQDLSFNKAQVVAELENEKVGIGEFNSTRLFTRKRSKIERKEGYKGPHDYVI